MLTVCGKQPDNTLGIQCSTQDNSVGIAGRERSFPIQRRVDDASTTLYLSSVDPLAVVGDTGGEVILGARTQRMNAWSQ